MKISNQSFSQGLTAYLELLLYEYHHDYLSSYPRSGMIAGSYSGCYFKLLGLASFLILIYFISMLLILISVFFDFSVCVCGGGGGG